ncbi:type VI secretion system-associated protein TagF [Archangium primigenium]|uniref:type VI secretion system-associated protein TagF n=1 Tax=[Archangium] primigenium TaxID=2792470 RepID=UPI00195F117A|nr:type VI secretion system-associated protein TagF [Archangium primigenium]MBM7115294.1 type VI secretion system-associated protein TagF [Archangium primigenium]
MRASSVRAGLVGKTPCQTDFLRLQATSVLAVQLHLWLAEGVEAARAARCGLPPGVVHFLFTAPGEANVLLGVFAPSTDGVGREFPLAVFTELPGPTAANQLAVLPTAFGPFLAAGAALLHDAATLDVVGLTQRVRALPYPPPEALTRARRQLQGLWMTTRGPELLQPLLRPGEAPGSPYYALHTFRTACDGERHRQRGRAHVVLECPLPPGLGPSAWLELATRLLRWPSVPPALLWAEHPEPRLLLCLGAMPPELLPHLARPGPGGQRLWPLRTSRGAAIEQAARALTEHQRRLIDSPTTSLEELLHGLSC